MPFHTSTVVCLMALAAEALAAEPRGQAEADAVALLQAATPVAPPAAKEVCSGLPSEENAKAAEKLPVQCFLDLMGGVRDKCDQLQGENSKQLLDQFENHLNADSGMKMVALMQRMMGVQEKYTGEWADYDKFFTQLDTEAPAKMLNEAEVESLLKLGDDVSPPAGQAALVTDLADADKDGSLSVDELKDFLQAVYCVSDMAQNVALFGKSIQEMESFATYEAAAWLRFR